MTRKQTLASVFDEVADGYDDRFSKQPIAKLLRGNIQQHLNTILPPNSSVLEIGCGTGEDARHLALKGHMVMATDPSPAMMNITRDKTSMFSGAGSVATELWNADAPMPDEVSNAGPFDMIFSNFGAINCITNLEHLKRQIVNVLKPGGSCVFVVINQWCMLEVIINLLARNRENMFRRFSDPGVARLEDGTTLNITYPSVADFNDLFAPNVQFASSAPVGVFLPPSELYDAFQKRPALLRLAKFLDGTLGRAWPFSRLGDHYMITLRLIHSDPLSDTSA